jgi:hypothetical protein
MTKAKKRQATTILVLGILEILLKQYRARKQAAVSLAKRVLTRVVLYWSLEGRNQNRRE